MKTIKKWEKSGLEWDDYFKVGDQIDEETFLYIAEIVPPEYCNENFVQGGEASFSKKVLMREYEKIYYHPTALRTTNGKYFYLGDLPSFDQFTN